MITPFRNVQCTAISEPVTVVLRTEYECMCPKHANSALKNGSHHSSQLYSKL